MDYDFTYIEKKWKQIWAEKEIYKVTEDASRPKYYVLDMFPYPSGAGLHVGHPLGYVASDIYARYKRLKGYNVLHPMGYDAFGLPAEQYAIETGTHPAITTEKAIKRYREQLDKIGFSFDWSRQVKTCDPDYYKWTQWLFLQLYNSWYCREHDKAEPIATLIAGFEQWGCTTDWNQFEPTLHPAFSADDWKLFSTKKKERILQHYRLAYRSYTEVNWCEALGCVLANDEVKDGKSERGGFPVVRKKMRQWSLRITEYADRLLEGLNRIEWSDSIKEQQRNWIGKSEGANVEFAVAGLDFSLEVFTTRPDTLFGATFLVVAPEHEFLNNLITHDQRAEVENYMAYVKSRTDVERQQEKKITGCFTGSYAVHPWTGKELPIWTAEYVLAGYGTGTIMAVPADDERDRRFAEKFHLPIVEIVDRSDYPQAAMGDKVGKLCHSDFLDGMEIPRAIAAAIERLEAMKIGKRKVNYKLRDASFSRQRYWGEPFPVKYRIMGDADSPFVEEEGNTDRGDEADIPFALSEKELPLLLPEVSSFKPTGDGRSPLANNEEWVKQGLETDTMPGYAGSSWYFLRYMDPDNSAQFAAPEKLNYWRNVDIYFGGAEHAVGHLLYSRMWHKVLFDLGYVHTDEPFAKLVNQGMIQGVSAFVYRLDRADNLTNTYPRPIFISHTVQQQIEQGKLSTIDVFELVGQKIGKANAVHFGLLEGSKQTPINVDIALVKDGILDEAGFRKWREEYAEAEFIYAKGEDNYRCGSAVEKMSKSKYNVINPDDVIAQYGADCFRMFEMFLGPIEQSKPWDDKGISGVYNFLRKFWRLFYDAAGNWKVTEDDGKAVSAPALKVLHKTLKKIEADIERLNFNTCISGLMIAVNELTAIKCTSRMVLEPLVVALAPFAPFTAEELWEKLGHSDSVCLATFPAAEEKYLTEDTHKYPVSINGKVRADIELSLQATPQEAQEKALQMEVVQKWLNGLPPKKFIFVKGKIINIVV